MQNNHNQQQLIAPSRQRAVQTRSAYLHWCRADPPSSLSTQAPSLAVAPRNEVIFLPFWRVFLAFWRVFYSEFPDGVAKYMGLTHCVCLFINSFNHSLRHMVRYDFCMFACTTLHLFDCRFKPLFFGPSAEISTTHMRENICIVQFTMAAYGLRNLCPP